MELTAVYSFADAMKKLMLTEEEHNEVIDLFEREIARQAEEDAKIAQNQARQLEMLMSGGPAISREAFSASLEDLYADADDSPILIVNKTDIAEAQRFLRSVKLREYADRLWRYEGVASPPIIWNASGPESNEPSNALKNSLLENEQQGLQTLEIEIGFENGEKRKGKALIRQVEKLLSGAKPVKRRLVNPSLKLPSGLRNSISSDDIENMARGPSALQAASSPDRQPAPPPPRRSPKQKKPAVPRVRFVKNSPAKSPTLQTPPRRVYNPLEHTPDSATTRRQTKSWLTDQVDPYTPLPPSEKTPSPLSTPSRTPKLWLTPSQARLAQIENILGTKTDAVTKPDRGYAVPIASPMGAPSELLPEKARSASRHVDAELNPVSGRIDSGDRDAIASTHKLGSEAKKQPMLTAHAKEKSVATAPPPKKRKIQGQVDAAYRTSGQKKPKTRGQDESSYKASGQKRQKVEVR
jgi:hypothetical protein